MNSKIGQSLFYYTITGNYKFINKNTFVRTYIHNIVTSEKLSDYVLSPIMMANYDTLMKSFERMKKVSMGIYCYQIPSQKTLLVCLLDKTIDDFRKFCKKSG